MENEPKFSDISPDVRVKVEELYKLISGQRRLYDGCESGICSVKINPEFCKGGAVCTSGIAGVQFTAG